MKMDAIVQKGLLLQIVVNVISKETAVAPITMRQMALVNVSACMAYNSCLNKN